MKTAVDIPWGKGTMTIPLPENWRLMGTLTPPSSPALESPAAELRHRLRDPIAARPLRDRDLSRSRIVIAVEDGSRPTPVREFFGALREELLAAGAQQENLSLLMALGVHRPMTQQEVEDKVGKENLQGLRWFNHDAKNPEVLGSLGATSRGTPVAFNRALLESDLILVVGGIEPHALLGFSGGVKMLLPGCASAETIACNHLQGVSPTRFDLVGVDPEASPMRLDMEEAARMLGKEIFSSTRSRITTTGSAPSSAATRSGRSGRGWPCPGRSTAFPSRNRRTCCSPARRPWTTTSGRA